MIMSKVEICGINTSKLLTLKEEEMRELLSKTKVGDMKARERLVLGNLKLVLSVIRRFNLKNDTADDLFQVGCIGLIKAIDNFNPAFDVKFSTYAVPMIIGEVRRFQRDNNSVRVSRSIRDLAYRALQVKEDVMRREQREPKPAEIAKVLGEDEKAVEEAIEAIVEPMSLYDSVFGDGEDSMYVIDKLADDTQSDEILIENIALKEALKKLSAREMNIIRRRYYNGKTQMEIADEIGISQAQVSRIEKGAIDKMRKYME
ncbi:MAG: RNA polymerase sporulation sigma factor SigG [Clostridia bacterium]|nr:RNA polymerase sporulation sigma factor SigG [Clostridia bacterium]